MISTIKPIHVINEFSIKNYSISSILEYLVNDNNKIIVLTNTLNKNFNIEKHSCIILDDLKIGFLRKFFFVRKIIKNFDEIHIHGLWSYLNLLSIFFSFNLKKKIIIYPHGMLMQKALEKPNFCKSFIKKILLKKINFYNYKNLIFSAASKQEAESILKNFANSKIFLNFNFIPFKPNNLKIESFQKNFVYFGRANSHKNIEKIINAFLKSKLTHEWKLDLYCIEDDVKYLNILKKKFSINQNISFHPPIFGNKKTEVMSKSWSNIIMSDSEALSLSILESGLNGLPTITSSNIEKIHEDVFSPVCKLDEDDLANVIKDVSAWSEQKRFDISFQLKNVYRKYLYKKYEFKHIFIKNKEK